MQAERKTTFMSDSKTHRKKYTMKERKKGIKKERTHEGTNELTKEMHGD